MILRGQAPYLWQAWIVGICMADMAQAGVWGMDPAIGVTGDYATNPGLLEASDTHEASGALLLDAPATYYADANKFSLLPSFRLGDTTGYSSVTSDYEHLSAKEEYDTERSTFTDTLGAARDSSVYFNFLSNGAAGVRRDSALADLNFDRKMTEKLEFDADVNATRVRYGDAAGASTLVDYKYVSMSPAVTWNTVERNKFSLTMSVGRYNSLDGTTESRNGNVQLGFVRQLSEAWTLTASGGYSRALNRILAEEEVVVFTPFGPVIEIIPVKAESAQNGSIYSANLAHQGTRLLLSATASRQIVPTGFAFLSRQQAIELKATYALSPRWTVSADVRKVDYQNPQANGTFYDIDVPYLKVTASWQWTEQWTVSLSAAHVRETGRYSQIDVQSQELTLTLYRRFNHIKFQ
jgi:hypothetical protein